VRVTNLSLKSQLRLVLGGLVAAVALWTAFTSLLFRDLGDDIETILRENYRSVVAAQDMKEALERIDSRLDGARSGRLAEAARAVPAHRAALGRALDLERSNVTLPGEAEAAEAIERTVARYDDATARLLALPDDAARGALYEAELAPLFLELKGLCDRVLDMNHRAMVEADRKARAAADGATLIAGLAAALIAGVGLIFTRSLVRTILRPIADLTASVVAISKGDLDQVLAPPAQEELGRLAAAFNAMAKSLRAFKKSSLGDLIQAREAAQAAIDSIADPVLVFDAGKRVTIRNCAAKERLTEGELPVEIVAAVERVIREGASFAPQEYERAIRLGGGDGERIFLPRAMPMRDDSGDLVGATLLLQDVTRWKRLDELKSDVVATVAHEIRTPLTALRMNTHLLLEEAAGPITPKQQELLTASREDCERLALLASSILDVARIEAGALHMRRRPVAPLEVAGAALEPFREAAQAKRVDLSLDVPADLPLIHADPDRLRLVFANLVSNALRYTPAEGKITVSAARAGERVRFEVADTGVGIAPEHMGRIFQKYYRAGAVGEAPESSGGAGLGLSIAREIVLAHEGEIGVESEPGSGARFAFFLPVSKEEST